MKSKAQGDGEALTWHLLVFIYLCFKTVLTVCTGPLLNRKLKLSIFSWLPLQPPSPPSTTSCLRNADAGCSWKKHHSFSFLSLSPLFSLLFPLSFPSSILFTKNSYSYGVLIWNSGERWKKVQNKINPQGGALYGILRVTPKDHCPESPAGSRWAPAGNDCRVNFKSEATGTVLCSEGDSRGRCAGLQAPLMCVGECLHPESTAPASWGTEASPGWKRRLPCRSQCILWALVVPSGALLCRDDSTLDVEATACTDSPTSSHSGTHSNSRTNPYLQRFPSFLSSWCPYYLHTFCSQCPGPKYPTIPLLMWLDPNNWSMLEKTIHINRKK